MTAIYARQSVDHADSISIEQQIELCKYETRGKEFRTYIDRGYSGKNTERPQFRQMMWDIAEGSIDEIIVYKLDRISRSILDFSNMMEEFGRHNVKFVSATEKFDTSSPMGNAMLNICVVFAQLERETIQKRVADAYLSRSCRSFYMGGRIPYGFRKIPTVIDGIHTSMFEPVAEEAEVVRMIYEMYAEPFVSCGDIIGRLNSLGIQKRGKSWGRQRIRELLINPIYVRADLDVYDFFTAQGADIADTPADFIGGNGCYSYKSGNENACCERIVLAPHKGIVDSSLWLKCQEKCMSRKQLIPSQKAKNSWLCGKIKCAECGYALIAKEYDSGRRRYLRCSGIMSFKNCKGCGTLYTDEVEEIVSNEIRQKLSHFPKLSCPKKASPDKALVKLEKELEETEKEIRGLLERVADCGDSLLRYINERVSALDMRRNELSQRIAELKSRTEPVEDVISDHAELWDVLSFDDCRQVTDILIRGIYACEGRITIQWRF